MIGNLGKRFSTRLIDDEGTVNVSVNIQVNLFKALVRAVLLYCIEDN